MNARLMEVLLRVRDLNRSVEFYRDGLGLPVKPGDEDESHFEVFWGEWSGTSPDMLMFLMYPSDVEHPPSLCELGFSVSDLATVQASVQKGGWQVVEDPSPKPWGMQATYQDPDGNLVAVAQAPQE